MVTFVGLWRCCRKNIRKLNRNLNAGFGVFVVIDKNPMNLLEKQTCLIPLNREVSLEGAIFWIVGIGTRATIMEFVWGCPVTVSIG